MGSLAGEPGLGPGNITVVVWSLAGRLTLLRDALYAIAALASASPRAIVVPGTHDVEHAEAITQLVGRFDGLLDIRLVRAADGLMNAAAAFNHGLAAVSTEFCTLQRDDHIVYPRHAAVLIDALRDEPSAAVAYGGGFRCWGRLTPEVFISERKQRWHPEPFDRARLSRESYIALPAAVIRTEHVRAARVGFDERLDDLEDWSFLRRLAGHRSFVAVDQPVGEHRVMGAESEDWPVDRRDPADHAYLSALQASPVERIYRTLSRTGLHVPLRTVSRAFQRRRRGS